jgi:hypothetical protein
MIRLRCPKCRAVYSASDTHVCSVKPAQASRVEALVKARALLAPVNATPVPAASVAASEPKLRRPRKTDGGSYYEAHREYMRDYMRKRRGSRLVQKGDPK